MSNSTTHSYDITSTLQVLTRGSGIQPISLTELQTHLTSQDPQSWEIIKNILGIQEKFNTILDSLDQLSESQKLQYSTGELVQLLAKMSGENYIAEKYLRYLCRKAGIETASWIHGSLLFSILKVLIFGSANPMDARVLPEGAIITKLSKSPTDLRLIMVGIQSQREDITTAIQQLRPEIDSKYFIQTLMILWRTAELPRELDPEVI